jgi:hypothetical protein
MLKLTQGQIIQKANELGLEVIDYNLQFSPALAKSWYDITHGIRHHDVWPGGTMEDIHEDHMLNKGYRGTGYHFRFPRTGGVEIGRPVGMIGGHCKQQEMNYRSLGLVWEGNMDEDRLTEKQFEDSAKFLSIFVDQLVFEDHNAFAKKSCPGVNFPSGQLMKRAEEIAETAHWAEEHFEELNEAFEEVEVAVHDRRFDDTITRGESMALQNNMRKLFEHRIQKFEKRIEEAYYKGVLFGRSASLEHEQAVRKLSSD